MSDGTKVLLIRLVAAHLAIALLGFAFVEVAWLAFVGRDAGHMFALVLLAVCLAPGFAVVAVLPRRFLL